MGTRNRERLLSASPVPEHFAPGAWQGAASIWRLDKGIAWILLFTKEMSTPPNEDRLFRIKVLLRTIPSRRAIL